MSIKIDRLTHGPSWTEVILGAVLSALLGIVIAVILLVLRPVVPVKELPKEADRDSKAVYYVQGSRDGFRSRQAAAKRKAFAEGQSVTVNEDELNALAAMPKAADPAKPGDPAKPAAKSGSDTVATGEPSFRIRDGALQVGVPVTVSLFGLNQKVTVQTRGGFAKNSDVFVYEPSEFYVGSCPVQRLPFVGSYVRNKYLTSQLVPDDIRAAWAKLAKVEIEGTTLKLTAP